MTPEAKKYIESLITEDLSFFNSIEKIVKGDIIIFTEVCIDAGKLSDEQHRKLTYFARNGSPEIIVEFTNHSDFNMSFSGEILSGGIDFIMTIDKAVQCGLKNMSLEQLHEQLKIAEMDEEYGYCQQIYEEIKSRKL